MAHRLNDAHKKAGIHESRLKTTKGRCGEEHLNDVGHSLAEMVQCVKRIHENATKLFCSAIKKARTV